MEIERESAGTPPPAAAAPARANPAGPRSRGKTMFWTTAAAVISAAVVGLVWSIGDEPAAPTSARMALAPLGPAQAVGKPAARPAPPAKVAAKPGPAPKAKPAPKPKSRIAAQRRQRPPVRPTAQIVPMDRVLMAVTNVNVRAAPSSRAKKTDTLSRGTKVTVTGKTKVAPPAGSKRTKAIHWYRVSRDDGSVGYIHASLLREPPAVRVRQRAAHAQKAKPEPKPKRGTGGDLWSRVTGSLKGTWKDIEGLGDNLSAGEPSKAQGTEYDGDL